MQLVRVSEERDLGESSIMTRDSLSDSLESGPVSERTLGSDSGLEQSADELELPAHRRRLQEEEEEAEFDDDIDLDQEIPGLNSENDDDDDDDDEDVGDEENNVAQKENVEKKESKGGRGDSDLGSLPRQRPSRVPGGVLLRPYDDDDDDIARLEDEMSEPAEDGLQENQTCDSDTEEPLGKETTTAAAITQMLSRLAVEGGPDYQQDLHRRDMTIR